MRKKEIVKRKKGIVTNCSTPPTIHTADHIDSYGRKQQCGSKCKAHLNFATYQFGSLLASQRSGVVSLIPLSEWKAVDQDDAVLHQGLGSHQLVVRGIVDHVDDPGLTCAACKHMTYC